VTTVHRCDRCGDEYDHREHLEKVSLVDGMAAVVDEVELCEDCDPEELVGRVLDLFDSYTADGGEASR
jgi:hypothetical protein